MPKQTKVIQSPPITMFHKTKLLQSPTITMFHMTKLIQSPLIPMPHWTKLIQSQKIPMPHKTKLIQSPPIRMPHKTKPIPPATIAYLISVKGFVFFQNFNSLYGAKKQDFDRGDGAALEQFKLIENGSSPINCYFDHFQWC